MTQHFRNPVYEDNIVIVSPREQQVHNEALRYDPNAGSFVPPRVIGCGNMTEQEQKDAIDYNARWRKANGITGEKFEVTNARRD